MPDQRQDQARRAALREFSQALTELRRQADNPSEQSLAKHMNCGRSSVSEFLTGRRFPSWKLTAAFVLACGGRPDEWRARWLATDRVLTQSRSVEHGTPLTDGATIAPAATATTEPQQAGPVRRPSSIETDEEVVFRATRYANHRRFYAAAKRQIDQTESQIRLVYVRQYPPSQYTSAEAADYFASVLDWAARPGVSVRRIVGVPLRRGVPDKSILDWLREDGSTQKAFNFEVRIFEWDAQADGLSLAIFDDAPVFLAFSGRARQNLYGRSVADPDFARDYIDYFEQLWPGIRSIEEYLDTHQ